MSDINIPKRSGEPDCTWADISTIHTHPGWMPIIVVGWAN